MPLDNAWPAEREQRLIQVWRLGWSQARIAKELGVGPNAIRNKAKRMGLPSRAPHKVTASREPSGTAKVWKPGDPSPYARRFIEKRST